MTHPLIETLSKLEKRIFSKRDPGDPHTLERVEKNHDLHFPDDFREVMLWTDGLDISYRRSPINVPKLDHLDTDNMEEEFEEGLPGMFIIGTDNGGSLYFFDPKGTLGRGTFAVYLVPQAEIGFDRAIFCGASFTETVEAVLRNESFFSRKRLKDEPEFRRH
jgi:hypothetical protein